MNCPSAILRLAAVVVTPLMLCSCSGGLSSLLGSGNYQGTWSGTAIGNGTTGQMSISIDANNNVSGTDTVSKPGYTTNDSGSISQNGNLTLVCQYAGTTVANISVSVESSGTTLVSTGGTITPIGGNSSTLSLDLNSQSGLLLKH